MPRKLLCLEGFPLVHLEPFGVVAKPSIQPNTGSWGSGGTEAPSQKEIGINIKL